MIYSGPGPGERQWSVWESLEDGDQGVPLRTYSGRFASARAQLSWAWQMARVALKALHEHR